MYRILGAEDLITAPADVVIRAADEVREKTARPNKLWQSDFTYLKVIGWGWLHLSTILDDYSLYIIAWKLCATMKVKDATNTLEPALDASGCNAATVVQKPRLPSDNGSSCVAADVHNGRGARILKLREGIKKQAIRRRRLQHQVAAT